MTSRAESKLLCSKAIRALIQNEGIETIFNNIYKTGTRTLKIYSTSLVRCDVNVSQLRDRIIDIADAFNFDVKFVTTAGRPWSPGAFIVKLI